MKRNDIPNLLTGARIVFSIAVFLGLAAAAGALPGQAGPPLAHAARAAMLWSFAAFVTGSLTDYFDGWLARRWNAMSPWGAMLDPIADKIAVCGAVLGMAALDPRPPIVVAGGVILFREFWVSGLREVGGARGLKFPVTKLAKWKTAVQLAALSLELLAAALADAGMLRLAADALMWLAAAITVWTGWEYTAAARKGLGGGSPPA
ncbi:MAG TPA: CDP-diacylglycerol--glycerol-3-phosphate 3-phosphatidyltransferase [Caulobacteraceae bacterium]|jgi:CDP-diacylglycerol--glycerol-3-phosphate 3-phosphatidyltransferase|nr:CDP-diacylglycerol--glycerol-3-phosphate 3-phosphatidyltransferase [Caulobacteraceae bacterium]